MNTFARAYTSQAASSKAQTWAKRGGIVIAGSLFLALCSHATLPLPWTVVPLNLQPFGVLLLALLFGPSMAAATAVLYLVEGVAGAPVFSPHGPGGLAQLLGPTGGYLMSYPVAAFVAGGLARRASFFANLGAAAAADLIVLTCGTVWLSVLAHIGLRAAFTLGAAPFFAGDFLKCAAAAALATAWFVTGRKS